MRTRQVHEVPCLEQHVRKLGVADAGIAFEPRAHGVFGHHVIDGQVLADVAQELEIADAARPVRVVDDDGAGWPRTEVEEAGELGVDSGQVGGELVVAEEIALGALARRIADHSRRAADDDDRLVSGALQPGLNDHRHQVTDVEARRRRVVAGVQRYGSVGQQFLEGVAIGNVGQQAAGGEFVENVHGAKITRSGGAMVPSEAGSGS